MSQCFDLDTQSVIFERFGNEVIAIHLDRGIYYSLNATAADIFELIAGRASDDAIVATLESKYSAVDGAIRAEVHRFFEVLKAEKLVRESASGASGAPAPAATTTTRQAFEPPSLLAHRDMQELFLLDPVHDVTPEGWPEQRPAER